MVRRRARVPRRASSPTDLPQGEEKRSGADHPGSRSGVEIFRKIEKIIEFQSALFGMKIELGGLWMCISHGAASFAMKIF